jgi:hypothetical protein
MNSGSKSLDALVTSYHLLLPRFLEPCPFRELPFRHNHKQLWGQYQDSQPQVTPTISLPASQSKLRRQMLDSQKRRTRSGLASWAPTSQTGFSAKERLHSKRL